MILWFRLFRPKIAPENVQNLGRSFTSPVSITLKDIQQSISLNPVIKYNEQNNEVSVICKSSCLTTYRGQKAVKDG